METIPYSINTITLTKIGGLLYLILIACGIFAELFAVSGLIVSGNPAATATSILDNESFYRSGIVAHIVTIVSGLFVMGIFYNIFKSTSEHLAITLVIFNVAALALEGVSITYNLEAISILKSKILLNVFSQDQVNALAYQPLKMQTISYDLGLLLFGVVCCLISILILKSGLFRRWIGWLMLLAGVCYITNSLVSFASPTLRNYLLPFILIPCFVAEFSLSINMIFKKP